MARVKTVVYWITTLWLALGMVSTAIVQLLRQMAGPGGVAAMDHLGYPVHLLPFLAFWKILGSLAILMPGFPVVKEWAYAGFFFIMTGAAYAHMMTDGMDAEIFPALLLLVLTLASWLLRPASRRIYLATT